MQRLQNLSPSRHYVSVKEDGIWTQECLLPGCDSRELTQEEVDYGRNPKLVSKGKCRLIGTPEVPKKAAPAAPVAVAPVSAPAAKTSPKKSK